MDRHASPHAAAYPPNAPSLLGQPYMAAQGQELVIGATQHSGLTPHEALSMCRAERRVAFRSEADPAGGLQRSPSAADVLSQSVGEGQGSRRHSLVGEGQGLRSGQGTVDGAEALPVGAHGSFGTGQHVADSHCGAHESSTGGVCVGMQPQHSTSGACMGVQPQDSSTGAACVGMQPHVAAATQELLQGAVQLWPALRDWRVKEVR